MDNTHAQRISWPENVTTKISVQDITSYKIKFWDGCGPTETHLGFRFNSRKEILTKFKKKENNDATNRSESWSQMVHISYIVENVKGLEIVFYF